MSLSLNEVKVIAKDEPWDEFSVVLWRVRGDSVCVFYPTKMAAEVAARVLFPNEDADTRYDRISYVRFLSDN